LLTNALITHSLSPQLVAVIKALFESKLFCQGIFPRQDAGLNAAAQELARNYLFKILVTDYEAMREKTFNRVCDFQMGVSYTGETLLQNVWKFYKTVYVDNVSKMIKTVIFASPFVLGMRSVDSISTTFLGEVTPTVFKQSEAEFTVVGLTWGHDGESIYDTSGKNGSYVKSIRAIFHAILKIHSLQEYIGSCGDDKLKSASLRGLNLDALEELVSDKKVGSVVKAIKQVNIMKVDLEGRVDDAANDDRVSLTTQEALILQNVVEIVASIDHWIGSCQMQLFRAYMRNDWEVYWLNPIRTNKVEFYSVEDTLEHLNATFMGFGAKVCNIFVLLLAVKPLPNSPLCLQLALGIVGGHYGKPKSSRDVIAIGEDILSEKNEGANFSFFVDSMKRNLRVLKKPKQDLIPQQVRQGESDHCDITITKELVVFLLHAVVLLTDEMKFMRPYANENPPRQKTAACGKGKYLHQQLSQQPSNLWFFMQIQKKEAIAVEWLGVRSNKIRHHHLHLKTRNTGAVEGVGKVVPHIEEVNQMVLNQHLTRMLTRKLKATQKRTRHQEKLAYLLDVSLRQITTVNYDQVLRGEVKEEMGNQLIEIVPPRETQVNTNMMEVTEVDPRLCVIKALRETEQKETARQPPRLLRGHLRPRLLPWTVCQQTHELFHVHYQVDTIMHLYFLLTFKNNQEEFLGCDVMKTVNRQNLGVNIPLRKTNRKETARQPPRLLRGHLCPRLLPWTVCQQTHELFHVHYQVHTIMHLIFFVYF